MSLKKFLALGDSYTIGEGVAPAERWPQQLVESLRTKGVPMEDPVIIATTGWTTQDLKKGIVDCNPGSDFDLVSLLIGVNNHYQGKPLDHYASDFEELLTMAIRLAHGNPWGVFVLSIPDYGFTPFGLEKQSTITAGINAFNHVNKKIAQEYNIRYFDISAISRRGLDEPELVASDKLHPSGKMYHEWVKTILTECDVVNEML